MQYKQLTEKERIKIFELRNAGESKSDIAKILGKHRSTISRELHRNSCPDNVYLPYTANRLSRKRKSNAYKNRKLTEDVKVWIDTLIRQNLSPAKVASFLVMTKGYKLHHTTIYRFIHSQKWSSKFSHLYLHLRNKGKNR